MSLSLDTLEFFAELLSRASLPANTPDIETQAARLARINAELQIELAAASNGHLPEPMRS